MSSSSANIKSTSAFKDLLLGVEQLNPKDFDAFVKKVLQLQAKKNAPVISKEESGLLLKINEGLSPSSWSRYFELIEKRQKESLGSAELDELKSISGRLEKMNARRLELIGKLAAIRKIPPQELMIQLSIQKHFNVL